MARIASGWKLEWRRGIGYARFTHAKRQHLISTGKRDAGKAAAEAARIYSRVISGTDARPLSPRALVRMSLEDLLAKWLTSLRGTLDVETVRTYETTYVGKHWLGFFATIEHMASESQRAAYRAARLRVATAETVKKECWVQDKFLRWAKETGAIGALPPALTWDKRTLGTRTGPQRQKAQELTREQVEAFLVALPAWRNVGKRALEAKPYPIRARFVVMYETGLRPATLSALRWADWNGDTLTIRDEADKVRFGREVPLSARAIEELAEVWRGSVARGLVSNRGGADDARLIFGAHLYLKTIARAARAAGLKTVAPYDLRHARATHLADAGASLTGIGHILGHKQATTTSRYLHPTLRAAEDALALGIQVRGSDVPSEAAEKQGDRRVSNPRQLEPQGSGFLTVSWAVPEEVAERNRRNPKGTEIFKVPDLETARALLEPLFAPRAASFVAGLMAAGAP